MSELIGLIGFIEDAVGVRGGGTVEVEMWSGKWSMASCPWSVVSGSRVKMWGARDTGLWIFGMRFSSPE